MLGWICHAKLTPYPSYRAAVFLGLTHRRAEEWERRANRLEKDLAYQEFLRTQVPPSSLAPSAANSTTNYAPPPFSTVLSPRPSAFPQSLPVYDGERAPVCSVCSWLYPRCSLVRGRVRERLLIDNLLVRFHLIIETISVDRPCAMGV